MSQSSLNRIVKLSRDLDFVPIMGMMIPEMGTNEPITSNQLNALFPQVRQRLLAILLGQPERSFYANELIRQAGSGIGAVQRELQSLATAGIIKAEMRGNQKHYQANEASPIFVELRGIITKTLGIPEIVRAALTPLADRIGWAMLYGSAVSGQLHAGSDADLMVISDQLTLEDLYQALAEAEMRLRRKINPTLYTSKEFRSRKLAGNHFLSKVLQGEHLSLIGSDDALA